MSRRSRGDAANRRICAYAPPRGKAELVGDMLFVGGLGVVFAATFVNEYEKVSRSLAEIEQSGRASAPLPDLGLFAPKKGTP